MLVQRAVGRKSSGPFDENHEREGYETCCDPKGHSLIFEVGYSKVLSIPELHADSFP
jgi:hypothetical protein